MMAPNHTCEVCAILEEQRRLCLAEAESKNGERQAWLAQADDLARLLERLGCPKAPEAGAGS